MLFCTSHFQSRVLDYTMPSYASEPESILASWQKAGFQEFFESTKPCLNQFTVRVSIFNHINTITKQTSINYKFKTIRSLRNRRLVLRRVVSWKDQEQPITTPDTENNEIHSSYYSCHSTMVAVMITFHLWRICTGTHQEINWEYSGARTTWIWCLLFYKNKCRDGNWFSFQHPTIAVLE
jgi:hypothetical protein